MKYQDTKYDNLETTLSAIGKAVFVNFYYEFKGTNLSDAELAEKIFRENPNAKSNKQGFRIPRARHIFQTGQEFNALEIIINSSGVDRVAREKAKIILQEEQNARLSFSEYEEEHHFISSLNASTLPVIEQEIVYDNSPKPAKSATTSVSHKYSRSKTVAQRALAKAKYLCECDPTHTTFKRKNSDVNYTEPHHLVPLYAAKDYPEIDLDREQNVVSLCSTCHNWIHYGDEIDLILRPLYEQRKDLLKDIGVIISYDQLRAYYFLNL